MGIVKEYEQHLEISSRSGYTVIDKPSQFVTIRPRFLFWTMKPQLIPFSEVTGVIMEEKECVFCKIVKKIIPSRIIFENDLNLAFLDISPISKGHTVVIPKIHYSCLEDISEYELTEIYKIVKKLAVLLQKKLKIDGYNILQNNHTSAGQVIKHFHVHIIPRYTDDNVQDGWEPKKLTEEQFKAMQEKIVKTLKAPTKPAEPAPIKPIEKKEKPKKTKLLRIKSKLP